MTASIQVQQITVLLSPYFNDLIGHKRALQGKEIKKGERERERDREEAHINYCSSSRAASTLPARYYSQSSPNTLQ